MWRFVGSYLDPHRFTYYPGMTRHNADRTGELLDGLLPVSRKPSQAGVAEVHRFTDHSGQASTALVWRTSGDIVNGFTCSDVEGIATGANMLAGARRAFPEVFANRLPFGAIQDAQPCPAEPKSEAPLSAASASSTATTAPESKPGRKSRKSSA